MLAMSSGSIRPSRWEFGKFLQSRVAGDEFPDAVGHGGGWGDGVDADFGREFDGHRAGDGGHRTLGGGVAVPAGDAHQGDIGRHVDDRPATGTNDRRDAEAAAEESAEQVQLDNTPEFLQRRVCDVAVLHGRAAGVVVQHMQRAVVLDRFADRCLDAFGFGDVCSDGDYLSAGLGDQLRGLLTGLGVDVRDDDLRTLLREQLCGRPADAGAGPGDDGDFSVQTRHVCFPLSVGGIVARVGRRIKGRGGRPVCARHHGTARPILDDPEARLRFSQFPRRPRWMGRDGRRCAGAQSTA